MRLAPRWVRLKNVTFYGAPVYLHRSVFLVAAMTILSALANPVYPILFIACYLAIILVHEFGHALAAHRLGYGVHSVHVTFWHGWCTSDAPDSEWEGAIIAWGGFLAQIALAVPPLLLMLVLGSQDWSYWTPVIVILGYLNVVWAITNILPDEDTDGRQAWRIVPIALQMRKIRRSKRRQSTFRS